MKRVRSGLEKFGLLVMAASVGIPALLWIALIITTATPGGCSECSLGWTAVGSVFLAVPAFMLGSVLALIGYGISKGRETKEPKEI